MTEKEISSRLRYIADQENVQVDDEVLNRIAELVDGGMRDAIGMLDKAISYSSDSKVSLTDFEMLNGIVSKTEKKKFLSDLLTFSTAKECDLIIVGIEDKETLEYVKKMGVRYVQGYYFARPDFKVISMNTMVKEKIKEASEDEI